MSFFLSFFFLLFFCFFSFFLQSTSLYSSSLSLSVFVFLFHLLLPFSISHLYFRSFHFYASFSIFFTPPSYPPFSSSTASFSIFPSSSPILFFCPLFCTSLHTSVLFSLLLSDSLLISLRASSPSTLMCVSGTFHRVWGTCRTERREGSVCTRFSSHICHRTRSMYRVATRWTRANVLATCLLPLCQGGAEDQSHDDGVWHHHGGLPASGRQGQLLPHGHLQSRCHQVGHRLPHRGDRETRTRPVTESRWVARHLLEERWYCSPV